MVEKAEKDTGKVLLELEKMQETEQNLKTQCELYEEEIMDLKRQLTEEKHKNKFAGISGGCSSLRNSNTDSLRDPGSINQSKDRNYNRFGGKNH